MTSDPNHFYVTLFSKGTQKLYRANTLSEFIVQLAQPIEMGSNERWEVNVCEFSCHPFNTGTFASIQVVRTTNALIHCNLISQQFMGSQYVLCLRTFIHPSTYCNHIIDNVYYVPVEKRHFQDIRIEILTLTGERISFKNSKAPTKNVLHFRRVSAW